MIQAGVARGGASRFHLPSPTDRTVILTLSRPLSLIHI